ncbi:MAG: hypothetical protein HC886_19805 [Leptolyngbyaceae cyanobacterium SM1_1_3]|nr:hypothetical protein [Leptolyngbyaceae cyanobacterium SM1_1_3]NJN02552.1 hypothetical protein [Leptolyngbyaceae cyanobacterium RM1_1_2]NJO08570.1 hypothetical protein [Leptolyngbyaceae cyanobacterium SL_1_1]
MYGLQYAQALQQTNHYFFVVMKYTSIKFCFSALVSFEMLLLADTAIAQSFSTVEIPEVSAVGDRQLQGFWYGESQTLQADEWNINLYGAFDCATLNRVDERTFSPQFIATEPAIDATTGNFAIGTVLSECVEAQQSAVFIVDPQPGGYALYRVQVPGANSLTDEFSSYPLSSLIALEYWNGYLLVRQGDAAGAEALLVFRPGLTPAGEYAGCIELELGEGRGLCPRQSELDHS